MKVSRRSPKPVGLDFLGDEPHRTTPEPTHEANRVLALRLEQGTEVLVELVAHGERAVGVQPAVSIDRRLDMTEQFRGEQIFEFVGVIKGVTAPDR